MSLQLSAMRFIPVLLLISTVKSHIFVYNLCPYKVPIWRDEVIGTTVIEVVDVSGDSFIEEDVPLVGLVRLATLEPDGSFSFEDTLTLDDTSYRFGEDGRMEARFASLPEYFEYYEINISDGFEVPMTIQPDRTGSLPVSCLNATCFGATNLGTLITSQTATTDIDTNFAIFLCPPQSKHDSLSGYYLPLPPMDVISSLHTLHGVSHFTLWAIFVSIATAALLTLCSKKKKVESSVSAAASNKATSSTAVTIKSTGSVRAAPEAPKDAPPSKAAAAPKSDEKKEAPPSDKKEDLPKEKSKKEAKKEEAKKEEKKEDKKEEKKEDAKKEEKKEDKREEKKEEENPDKKKPLNLEVPSTSSKKKDEDEKDKEKKDKEDKEEKKKDKEEKKDEMKEEKKIEKEGKKESDEKKNVRQTSEAKVERVPHNFPCPSFPLTDSLQITKERGLHPHSTVVDNPKEGDVIIPVNSPPKFNDSLMGGDGRSKLDEPDSVTPAKSKAQEVVTDGGGKEKSSKKGGDEKKEDKKDTKSKVEAEDCKIDVRRSTMDNPDSVTPGKSKMQEAPPDDEAK